MWEITRKTFFLLLVMMFAYCWYADSLCSTKHVHSSHLACVLCAMSIFIYCWLQYIEYASYDNRHHHRRIYSRIVSNSYANTTKWRVTKILPIYQLDSFVSFPISNCRANNCLFRFYQRIWVEQFRFEFRIKCRLSAFKL